MTEGSTKDQTCLMSQKSDHLLLSHWTWTINLWNALNDDMSDRIASYKKTSDFGCLTFVVSPFIARSRNIVDKQWVTISVNNSLFPAKMILYEQIESEVSLLNNGCIPFQIIEARTFHISLLRNWKYARRIVFSITNINSQKLNGLNNFPQYIKKKCILSFFIKPQMTVYTDYLTQKLYLSVNQVDGYFNQGDLSSEVVYKVYEHTKIEITCSEFNENNLLVDFSHFGGYHSEIEFLKLQSDLILNTKRLCRRVEGILISGPSGVGKSFIADILISMLGDKCLKVSSQELLGLNKSKPEEHIKLLFDKAYSRAPAIVFFDDIDQLCIDREKGGDVTLINTLLHLMDGISNERVKDLILVATATNSQLLDGALRRPGRLSKDIILSLPQESDKEDILGKLFKNFSKGSFKVSEDELIHFIKSRTPGYSAGDLKLLLTEALIQAKNDFLRMKHFETALKIIKPAALRNIKSSVNELSFEKIIGYEDLKLQILDVFKVSYSKGYLLENSGLSPPVRFLFFGPSGCGKSMFVHALATLFNMSVVVVKRSNVFGKYFGESEKNLAKLFEQAQNSAPCILHFENFESLAGRKSKDSDTTSNVEGRIINHLKVMLDGVVQLNKIFVIAETNRPHLLDKNVIRHGRFHRYCYFDLPFPAERLKAFKFYLEGFDISESAMQTLVEESNGFAMSEIRQVCEEVKSLAPLDTSGASCHKISPEDISSCFEVVLASTSSKMLSRLKKFASMYCGNKIL